MAVNTKRIVSGPFKGNGLNDRFPFKFKITDSSEITVRETDNDGNETALVLDTDYTVHSLNNERGGYIKRLDGALPENYTLLINSNFSPTQLVTFESPYDPDEHEAAFDKLTYLIQQLEEVQTRTVSFRYGYTGGADTELPDPEAEYYLRWNEAEDALENVNFDAIPTAVTGDELFHVSYQLDAEGPNIGGGDLLEGWQTRPINTVVQALTDASLAANQITLPAGTYYCEVWGALIRGDYLERLKLYNVTDAQDELNGLSVIGDSAPEVAGVFVIESEKTFELKQYADDGVTLEGEVIVEDIGLGTAVNRNVVNDYNYAIYDHSPDYLQMYQYQNDLGGYGTYALTNTNPLYGSWSFYNVVNDPSNYFTTLTSSSRFTFDGDFCIEFDYLKTEDCDFLGRDDLVMANSPGGWEGWFMKLNSNGFSFSFLDDLGDSGSFSYESINPNDGQRHSICFERENDIAALYLDGVRIASALMAGDISKSGLFQIGHASGSGHNAPFIGYLDRVRITQGVGRYHGEDYTPLTGQFPDTVEADSYYNYVILLLDFERPGGNTEKFLDAKFYKIA